MLAIVSLLILPFQVFAAPEFNSLRYDESVPSHCHNVEITNFQFPAEYFFIGRQGAVEMGFTFEYPLKRSNATVLWEYFKSVVADSPDLMIYKSIQSDPVLKRDYEIIKSIYVSQDFDFGNEGEILEILAIHKLYEEFPENVYFITGGVEYRNEGSHTLGELDIYVARKDTCEVIAVGEAKLGKKKTLNKAKKQIQRFSGFLADNHGPKLSNEYKPQFFEDGKMRDQSLPVRQCLQAL